ncbi:HlyD family type I secretion periplasmic adaptor subunit [Oxalobacteraceae bacterium OTU3CAMAD1]|nr:HlyD family type I secretion periplasmic adaptor subunit [Oxalobacteraceae bacterium OTU3CAMAD1]
MTNAITKKEEVSDVVVRDIEPMLVNTDARVYARIGWLIVLLGMGGFLLWAFLAPLDKGVPMSGTVAKASNRQAVQHQMGGTVRELLVRDGDVVKAGQVLLRMDSVLAKSQSDISRAQYLTARATEARLMAERDGKSAVTFSEELLALKNEPRAAEIMNLQSQLFSSRTTSLRNELSAIDQNIAGLKALVAGTKESRDSKKQQMNLLKEQLDGMRDLAKEGYVARNRLLDLERTYAQIGGSVSEDIGMIGRSQSQIMELTLRRSQRQQDYQKEVRTSLSDVQKEAESLAARLTAQDYELANVEVKAPVSGTVVGSAVFTQGAVVAPGYKLMDIVPSDDPLVVEGQLPVHLVDKVHAGLPVELMFSAFNSNRTPHIPGQVERVSADRFVDERTGVPTYHVRVKVTPEGAKLIASHKLVIQSGMPVEVFVKTGERSMMSYLLKPLADRAKSSLSEE